MVLDVVREVVETEVVKLDVVVGIVETEVVKLDVVLSAIVVVDVVVAGFEEVVDDDEEEEEDEATPGRHCEYQGFEKTHVYPDTQVVGPVQSIPPHLPHAPA